MKNLLVIYLPLNMEKIQRTFTWNGLEGRVEGKGNVKIDHTQVHHIIPLNDLKPEADGFEAYDFIKETGFDLEDDTNKMVLPNKKGAEISGIDSAIHEGGHNQKYADVIEEQLKEVAEQAKEQGWYDLPKGEFQANCQDAIKERIQEIRAKLESGDLPLNKNGSNKLNNGLTPEAGI